MSTSGSAGAMGAGPPAALLHVGDQGPARRGRAARRVRAQSPQGAPPGRADLAVGPRLHAHRLAARLTAQPARLRRGRPGVRARAARSARRARATSRGGLRDASASCSTTPTEKLFVHHEEFGDRLLGVIGRLPALRRARRSGHARDLDHREAHEPQRRIGRPRDRRRQPSTSTSTSSSATPNLRTFGCG